MPTLIADTSLKMTKDAWSEVASSIKALADKMVLVGVPAETAPRRGDPLTNAAIAYIHEHGAPGAHIPPRPFLFPTIAARRTQIAERLKQAAKYTLDQDSRKTDMALEALGLETQAAVRLKIVHGPFFPLSPRTIARRKAKGVTRTKPLIDTGNLIASITYVIRSRATNKDLVAGSKMPWRGTKAAQQPATTVIPTRGPAGGYSYYS